MKNASENERALRLARLIGEADDAYIEAADPGRMMRPRRAVTRVLRAASFLLLIGVTALLLPRLVDMAGNMTADRIPMDGVMPEENENAGGMDGVFDDASPEGDVVITEEENVENEAENEKTDIPLGDADAPVAGENMGGLYTLTGVVMSVTEDEEDMYTLLIRTPEGETYTVTVGLWTAVQDIKNGIIGVDDTVCVTYKGPLDIGTTKIDGVTALDLQNPAG